MVRSEKAAWWRRPGVGAITGPPKAWLLVPSARAGTPGSWLQSLPIHQLPILSLCGLTTFSYPSPATPAARAHMGLVECREQQPCGPRMR